MNFDYIAGFFDGEGCVTYFGKEKSYIRVSMSNTNLEVLKDIHNFLGVGRINQNIKATPKHKACYNLVINKRADARKFLTEMHNKVIIKRVAVEQALQFLGKQYLSETYPHAPPSRLLTMFVQDEYLEGLDNLVKAKKYPNRSETIRFAVTNLLEKEGKIP